jgi:hypothetical protein
VVNRIESMRATAARMARSPDAEEAVTAI